MIFFILGPLWAAGTLILFAALLVRSLRTLALPGGFASLFSLPAAFATLVLTLRHLVWLPAEGGWSTAGYFLVLATGFAFGYFAGAFLGFAFGCWLNKLFGIRLSALLIAGPFFRWWSAQSPRRWLSRHRT